MHNVFMSVLPIFLLIVTGYVAKNYIFNEEVFWKVADKTVYYIFFPSLLILEISNASFSGENTATALGATIGGTMIVGILIFAVQIALRTKDDLFTSIFQGGVRYNSYVFLALSQSLFGAAGVALSGVFIAYMIVLTNTMSVLVMNHYGHGGKKTVTGMAASLLKNPLIVGAMVGLTLNGLDIHISGAVEQFMKYLGGASTPLSLMSVGGGLILSMHARKLLATFYSTGLKLLVMPACTMALLKVMGASGTSAQIAVLYASVPCAGNAYILARQMGGDSEAMASIITWTTLLSIVTITVILGSIL